MGKKIPDDRKPRTEQDVFLRFASLVRLAVVPGSVQSRPDPEPDILCKIEGRGEVAFELTTLDGRPYRDGLEKMAGAARSLMGSLRSPAELAALNRRYGNVTISVYFRNEAKRKVREAAVTPLKAALLAGLERVPHDEQFAVPESLKSVIRRIVVYETKGPFQLTAGAIVTTTSSDTLNNIRNKLSKSYETPHPIELLCHTYKQPWSVTVGIESQIEDLIRSRLKGSQFQRAWVVDVQVLENALKFVYPPAPES